ncbi:MAG: YciI family protein [Imperialibacter sp.]
MKKFLVIYHSPADAMEQTAGMSKEDQAKGMEAWMVWAKKCGDKLVDMGSPLMNGQALIPDGSSKGSKKEVAGFSILQADSMEQAKKLLIGHPHLAWNAACSIEVHETMPLPGM